MLFAGMSGEAKWHAPCNVSSLRLSEMHLRSGEAGRTEDRSYESCRPTPIRSDYPEYRHSRLSGLLAGEDRRARRGRASPCRPLPGFLRWVELAGPSGGQLVV